jgi:hypothetical protein
LRADNVLLLSTSLLHDMTCFASWSSSRHLLKILPDHYIVICVCALFPVCWHCRCQSY